MTIELAELQLPEFGLPTVEPQIPAEEYATRIEDARKRMRRARLDALIIYGDREHFANLAYLTGYDPRFEESVGVLPREGKPTLVVGNEGVGYAALSPLDVTVALYQTFSLPGQPRDRLAPLWKLLRKAGVKPGARVGLVGWKHFERGPSTGSGRGRASEVPAFILTEIEVAVAGGTISNATTMLMNPRDGLRTRNSVHQLARFEYAATLASQMVRDAIFNLRVGMSEFDAVRAMRWSGWPLSCHLMLSAGERARVGLASPSSRALQLGDPFTVAVGLWGGLTARAGFLVHDPSELPSQIQDYVEKLAKPYFRAAAAWYETVGIGVTGGALFAAVHRFVGKPFFGVNLNPGHLIHLDEWLHSPVARGSEISLQSGMALQCDIIPATGGAYFTSNIEDGIALADDDLRGQFASLYPEAWSRIQARRRFMQEALGIRLKPEALPFSNLCGYLPPFLLNPRRAMRVATGERGEMRE
ncbi:MAG: aminopeptidase P family N-terminal domain-containing protein [Chloroflexi bacterium]|nr:aminopeptidase P family N-terminal domain-containing protein [Chloroflexota bacterium]